MLKKVYLFFTFFLFAVSLFLGIDRFFHQGSSHFGLNKIRASNLFSSEWGTPTLSPQEMQTLRQIFNQKFVLYNKGSRSYVCLSEDGKYILKFLKYQRLNTRSWLAHIPLSFNPFYLEYLFKKSRCQALLNAWKTAFTQLKTETGIIYMHTNKHQALRQKVIILDKDVQEYRVDLDKTIFCVQKHADLIYLRIVALMHEGNLEEAKGIIDSIFSLIDRLGKKGAIDEDFCSDFNFGLVGKEVIQVDIGKLQIDPIRKKSLIYKQKIEFMTQRLGNWLEESYPELSIHFKQRLERSKRSD